MAKINMPQLVVERYSPNDVVKICLDLVKESNNGLRQAVTNGSWAGVGQQQTTLAMVQGILQVLNERNTGTSTNPISTL